MAEVTVSPAPAQPGANPHAARMAALRAGIDMNAFRAGLASREERSLAGRIFDDVVGGASEALPQVARGVAEAVNEMSDLTHWAASKLEKAIPLGGFAIGSSASNGWFEYIPPEEWARRADKDTNHLLIPEDYLPDTARTVTGNAINDIAQFVTGMVAGGKALRLFGVGPATTTAGAVAQGAAKGAFSDFVAFDPHEERLANLIEAYPSLANPVTEYLAADPNDGEIEGRFKNALMGLGLGAAADTLLHGLRLLKAAKRGDQKAVEEAVADAEKAAAAQAKAEPEATPQSPEQMALPLEGGGPKPDSIHEVAPPTKAAQAEQQAAALAETPGPRTPEFKPVKKRITLSDDALTRIRLMATREELRPEGIDVRTDLVENEEDIRAVINAISTVYREEITKVKGGDADGVRTFAAVKRNAERLADIIGDDHRLLVQRMSAQTDNIKHLDAELRAYETYFVSLAKRWRELAEIIDDPLGSNGGYPNRAALYADFAKHTELLANVQAMYKGMQTNVARALNAMKLGASPDTDLLRGMDVDAMFRGGEKAIRSLARKVRAAGDNPKALAKLARGGFFKRLLDSHNEYWINSLLSSPKTQAINFLGNLTNVAFHNAERFVAGSLRIHSRAGREEMMDAALSYVTMVLQLRDAARLAGKAFLLGDNILDPRFQTVEVGPAITAQNWGVSDPLAGMLVNGLGTMVRLPTRLLMTEDEFVKQMAYRGRVQAQAVREAFQQGLWRDPKAFAEYVSKRLDDAVDADGRATDEAALRMAQEVTFTNPLKTQTWTGGASIGEGLAMMAARHPGLRMIVPFVRTPTNIMRFVWDHTPVLNMTRRQIFADMTGKNGAQAQAQAVAKTLTGAALWATALTYAFDGTITGGGPLDPKLRKARELSGWRPYSARVVHEDGRVEYRAFNRFDPYGMFLGMAADVAEMSGHLDDKQLEEVAGMMVVALVKNLHSKSYLRGVTEIVQALADPERFGERLAQSRASSYVPAFMQALKDDEAMREAYSVIDAMRARIPGLSEQLDPVRNVLGEVVDVPTGWGPDWLSPFAQSFDDGDPVKDELSRQMLLHEATIQPPRREQDGVDLTAFRSRVTGRTAYDRWLELHGTTKIGGMTLKEALTRLVASPLYKERLTDGNAEFDGTRLQAIQATVSRYRQKALADLMREEPELADALRQARLNAALVKRRGAAALPQQ